LNNIYDFLEHIDKHTEQDIIENMPYIKTHFRRMHFFEIKQYLEKILQVIDKRKVLEQLFKDEQKFSLWKNRLDFPEKLKFGLEIEVGHLQIEAIESAFKSNSMRDIMRILEVPNNISSKIIDNSDFRKNNEPTKWVFSPEAGMEESEASSPIMTNNLQDLNQIVAICTLFKALNAQLHGGTGLHINVAVDYLECNEKAVENLLKIWGECEELFYKIANEEGDVIRGWAKDMASPIKQNIQSFFMGDGSVTLNTEEDMERFLYQIQAQNRIEKIVAWSNFGPENDIEYDLYCAKTDEDKFQIYRRYEKGLREKGDTNSKVRWTSINFNHMEWNVENPGRIEIRIFNSSLEPKIIFEDLVLVGKIFETSLECAKNPDYKKEEFEKLFLRNVTEEEKVNNLLNLLFDKIEQKNIFKNRWESVRKDDEYKKLISGRDTFER